MPRQIFPASREFYLKNGTTLLSQGFSGLRNSSNLQAAIRSFRNFATALRVASALSIQRLLEVIIASWCGRKVNKDFIASRPGWSKLSAVRNRHVYEVKSTYMLQPGPAALTEGVRQLHTIISHVAGVSVKPELCPQERVDPDLKTGWNSRPRMASSTGATDEV